MLGALKQNIGYAIRTLFKNRGLTLNVPLAPSPWPQASLAIKTSGDSRNVVKSIAAAVNSVDPDLPLAGVRTVDEIVSESLAIDRFSVVLFASFGVLGLMLVRRGCFGCTCV